MRTDIKAQKTQGGKCGGCIAKPTQDSKTDMDLCASLPPCSPCQDSYRVPGKVYPKHAIIWVKA